MDIGDVVTVRSVRVYFKNEKAEGYLDYKAPKGEQFVLLLLGAQTESEPLDPLKALNRLGWVAGPEHVDVDAQ